MAEVEAAPAEDTAAAISEEVTTAINESPVPDVDAAEIKPAGEAVQESTPEETKPVADAGAGAPDAAKEKQQGLKSRLASIKSKKVPTPNAGSSPPKGPLTPPSDGPATPERTPRTSSEQRSPLQKMRGSPSGRLVAKKTTTRSPGGGAVSTNGGSPKAGGSPKGDAPLDGDAAGGDAASAGTPTRLGPTASKAVYKPKVRGLKRMIDMMGMERVEALMLEKDDTITKLQDEVRELKSQQRQAVHLAQKDKEDFDPKKQKSMAEEITFLRNALKKEQQARNEAELASRKAVRAAEEIKEAKAFSVKPHTGTIEPPPPPVGVGMSVEQLQRELQLKDATLQDLQRKLEVVERAKESSHRMHLLKEKEYKMHIEAARAEADATMAALAEKDKELRLACLQLKEAKAGYAPNPKSKGRHLNPLSPSSAAAEDSPLSPTSSSPKGAFSLAPLSPLASGAAASPKPLPGSAPGSTLPMPPKEKREQLESIPAGLKERRHSLEAANNKLKQKQPLPPTHLTDEGDAGGAAAPAPPDHGLPTKPHLKVRTGSDKDMAAAAAPADGVSPLTEDGDEEVDLKKYMPPWCNADASMTEEQYLTVQATWQVLREGKFEKFQEQSLVRDGVHMFGVVVYDKLFQLNPRLRALFSNKFRQSHSLISSFDKTLGMLPGSPRVAAIKAQGKGQFAPTPKSAGGMLPAGLGNIISQYQLSSGEMRSQIDPELVPVLKTLARKHVTHKVHYKDYGTMGEAVLASLEHLLPADIFTAEARTAWVALWSMLCVIMLPVHVRTCIQRQLPHLIDETTHALEAPVVVEKGPTVLAEDLEDVSKPIKDITKYLPSYVQVEPKLEFEQAQLVQDTWQAMKEGEYDLFESQHAVESATNFFGMCFYDILFEMDPALRVLFKRPFNQITMVTTAMDTAVSMLPGSPRIGFFSPKRDKSTPFSSKKDDTPRKEHVEPELVPALQQIARRHAMYGIHYKDYGTVGAAFVATLAKLLGPEVMDEQAKAAWVVVWSLMCSVMIPVHVDVVRKRKKGVIRPPSAIAKEAAEAEARQEAAKGASPDHAHGPNGGENHPHHAPHHAHGHHVAMEEPSEHKAHFGGQPQEIGPGEHAPGEAAGGKNGHGEKVPHGHKTRSHEEAAPAMMGVCPVPHGAPAAEGAGEVDANEGETAVAPAEAKAEGQGKAAPEAAVVKGAHAMADDEVRLDEPASEAPAREAEDGAVAGANDPARAPSHVDAPESEAADQVAELQADHHGDKEGGGDRSAVDDHLSHVEIIANRLARGSLEGDDGHTESTVDEF
eukprot:jgi/Mesvir1/11590/Mv00005-RA.1